MGFFSHFFKNQISSEKLDILEKENEADIDARIFSHRALEAQDSKNYLGAIENFTKAIVAKPTDHNLYLMRGIAYKRTGNDTEAEKDLKKTIGLEPKSFLGAYHLGMIYCEKKDFERAIDLLKVSFHNYPQDKTHGSYFLSDRFYFIDKKHIAGNLGNLMVQAKRFDEAFRYLDEAIKLDPQYHNPYHVKGMALALLGKIDEGIPYIIKSGELGNPKAEESLEMLNQLSQQESQEAYYEAEDLELDFKVQTSHYVIFENGNDVSKKHEKLTQIIEVETNKNKKRSYIVKVYKSYDGGETTSLISSIEMDLVNSSIVTIELRRYQNNDIGEKLADYGLTILHNEGIVKELTLQIYKKGIEIYYLPSSS